MKNNKNNLKFNLFKH